MTPDSDPGTVAAAGPGRPGNRARLAPVLAVFAGVLTVLAGGTAAGCGLLELDTDTGLELNWTELSEDAEIPDIRVTGGLSSIGVSGNIAVELPCQPLAGDISERGDEITLTVTALSDRALCPGDPTVLRYSAGILNLAPGERSLTVVHAVETGDAASETVFQGSVQVR